MSELRSATRRHVIRNSFARHSIYSERVRVPVRAGQEIGPDTTCAWCGSQRFITRDGSTSGAYLYRFHVDDDNGSRCSGPIAHGKLFCSRGCAETYIDKPFDETKG